MTLENIGWDSKQETFQAIWQLSRNATKCQFSLDTVAQTMVLLEHKNTINFLARILPNNVPLRIIHIISPTKRWPNKNSLKVFILGHSAFLKIGLWWAPSKHTLREQDQRLKVQLVSLKPGTKLRKGKKTDAAYPLIFCLFLKSFKWKLNWRLDVVRKKSTDSTTLPMVDVVVAVAVDARDGGDVSLGLHSGGLLRQEGAAPASGWRPPGEDLFLPLCNL